MLLSVSWIRYNVWFLLLSAGLAFSTPGNADSLEKKGAVRRRALLLLEHEDCNKRLTGLRRLSRIESDELLLKDLTFQIIRKCKTATIKTRAILQLLVIDEDAAFHKEQLQTLIEEMSSRSPEVRSATIFVLAHAGADISEILLPKLEKRCDPIELAFVCWALRHLGAKAPNLDRIPEDLVEILRRMLHENSDVFLASKVFVFGDLFPAQAFRSIPRLIEEAGQCQKHCDDAYRTFREQWRRSKVSNELETLLAGTADLRFDLLREVEFLRSSSLASLLLLKKAMASSDVSIVLQAVAAARSLGEGATALAQDLEYLVASRGGEIRRSAAFALIDIDEDTTIIETLSEIAPELSLELLRYQLERLLD